MEVYMSGAGWITFDPTNRSVGGFNLIPIGVARDFRQAMPMSGSFIGLTDAFIGEEHGSVRRVLVTRGTKIGFVPQKPCKRSPISDCPPMAYQQLGFLEGSTSSQRRQMRFCVAPHPDELAQIRLACLERIIGNLPRNSSYRNQTR